MSGGAARLPQESRERLANRVAIRRRELCKACGLRVVLLAAGERVLSPAAFLLRHTFIVLSPPCLLRGELFKFVGFKALIKESTNR